MASLPCGHTPEQPPRLKRDERAIQPLGNATYSRPPFPSGDDRKLSLGRAAAGQNEQRPKSPDIPRLEPSCSRFVALRNVAHCF